MGIFFNVKFFQFKFHSKISFISSKNDIVKFSARDELFINTDNDVGVLLRS